MDRRSFLKWLTGTAVGVALAPTLDLDKLLWVPGEKTIFIPPLFVEDGTLITSQWFTREAMKVLENNLTVTKLFNRQYDDHFAYGYPIKVLDRRRRIA